MSERIYFCGTIDVRAVRGADAAWQKKSLTYYVTGVLPGVKAETFRRAVADACAQAAAVVPLSFSEAGPGTTPDLVVTAGRIDGPNGVLAYSELPNGSDRQLTQKYDTSERFVVAERPPAGQIDLAAVVLHELCHALGLEHAPEGSGDLMEPAYVPGRRTLQPGDVRSLQSLYGKPPAPPLPPPAPGKWNYSLAINKTTGEATLTQV